MKQATIVCCPHWVILLWELQLKCVSLAHCATLMGSIQQEWLTLLKTLVVAPGGMMNSALFATKLIIPHWHCHQATSLWALPHISFLRYVFNGLFPPKSPYLQLRGQRSFTTPQSELSSDTIILTFEFIANNPDLEAVGFFFWGGRIFFKNFYFIWTQGILMEFNSSSAASLKNPYFLV